MTTTIDKANKTFSLATSIIAIIVAIASVSISWYKVDLAHTEIVVIKEKYETKENNNNLHKLSEQRIKNLEKDRVSKQWLESEFKHLRELIEQLQ